MALELEVDEWVVGQWNANSWQSHSHRRCIYFEVAARTARLFLRVRRG